MDFGVFALSDTGFYHVDHPTEKDEDGTPVKVYTDDMKPVRFEIIAPHTRQFRELTADHLKAVSRLQDDGGKVKKKLHQFETAELTDKAEARIAQDAKYAASLVVGWENMQINGVFPEFSKAAIVDIINRPGFIGWLPKVIKAFVDDNANFYMKA